MHSFNPFKWLALALTLGAGMAPVHAVPPNMNLSKAPLFINAAVDPNLVVTFDDSGSMAWGYIPDSLDASRCIWRQKRYYSAAANKLYYNPDVSYLAPLRADGTRYPDASASSALVDPFSIPAVTTTVNLTTSYAAPYDTVASDLIQYDSRATSTADDNCYDLDRRGNRTIPRRTYAFPHAASTPFYCSLNAGGSVTNNDDYTCQAVPATQMQNFANWFTYYRARGLALKSAVSRSFGTLDDNIQVAWQNMRTSQIANTTTIGRFNSTRRTDFFNWLFDSPFSGNTPTLTSTFRVGEFFQRNGSDATNPYWDSALNMELSCRQNFHVLVTDGYWNESDHTTLPTRANDAILNTATFPDGVSYAREAESKIFWNEDARATNQCTNNDGGDRVRCRPSYSDIAFHYWKNDLRGDLSNNVPRYVIDRSIGVTGSASATIDANAPWNTKEIYFNPVNDPANWQHLVQFFIGFGIDGTLPYNATTYDALRRGTQAWPDPRNLDPRAVDDSWHAALASRGKYFSASDPNALVTSLSDILNNIVARRATGSALTVSSGIIASDTLSFQTRFDSSDWSGTVLARPLRANFTFGSTPTWDAGCRLTGGACPSGAPTSSAQHWDTGREILTVNSPSGTGIGVPFRWSQLSAGQQSLLNVNPSNSAADTLGQDRLKFLRGERRLEGARGGTFRNRNSVMGAIVHSAAAVVDAPASGFEHQWPAGTAERTAADAGRGYLQFRQAHANRARTLYVGANDGMMHAIDAATGNERWAYVPWATYRNLNKLTSPLYNFEPYVDNTPTVRDVFYGGAWRTVLLGSLRRGGQGVFAIDITDPNLTEADAGSKVLWEFNDSSTGGADLGYTYGQPFITRLHSGEWAALVPGGYYSHEADGNVGSGNAVLYVLRISDGRLLKKFDLGAMDSNAQGLATPLAIDLDRDDISEFAYAGDLAGHLWRFDLRGNNATAWSASKLYTPTTAFARPITAQPRAMFDAATRTPMILVGTGKYIENADRTSSIPVQAFLSVFEQANFTGTVTEAQLTSRDVSATSNGFRSVSSATHPSPAPTAPKGWQVKFSDTANRGERVITTASVRLVSNRVVFTTLVPSGNDPCVPGGKSFLMVLNASTGGTPAEFSRSDDGGQAGGGSDSPIFDTNNDGKINDQDNRGSVGKQLDGIVPGAASVLPPGGGEGAIITPSPGGSESDPQPIVTKVSEFEWRRRSWNEVFPKR